MEFKVTTGSICTHSCDENESLPLKLLCGHSFCQACMEKLEIGINDFCPICKSPAVDPIPTESPASLIVSKEESLNNDQKLEESGCYNTCKKFLCRNSAKESHRECDRSLNEQEDDSTGRVESGNQSQDFKDCVSSTPEEGGGWSVSDSTLASDAAFAMQDTDARPAFVTPEEGGGGWSVSDSTLASDAAFAMQATDARPAFVTPEEGGGGWSVSDSTLASDAAFAMQATNARPAFVTVTGTSWRESVLLEFLSTLSNVECPVYLTPRDTLWRPSEEGKKTSRARIETLLAKGHRCNLVFVWGALDLPTLSSLPKSVKNIGIVMARTEDMQLVDEVDKWGHQLEFIHFSFMKSFLGMDWGRRTLTPPPDEDISICLHFPDLHEDDLKWMQSVVSAVAPSDEEKSSVWGLYFPGTSLSADDALSAVVAAGLQCKVFLPASRALEGGERKKVLKKYKRHKCSVEWILEDI